MQGSRHMSTKSIHNIVYEQPFNESMRICLCLEHLFDQLHTHTNQLDAKSNHHLAISALVKTLDVIHRPDLKSKLTQMLIQQVTTLTQLKQFPQVDSKKLQNILKQLDQLISSFHDQQSRIGEQLRNNEFINHIRLRRNSPGGAGTYSLPAYALWLKKPAKQRQEDLKNWAAELSELQEIINLTLHITRNNSEQQTVTATNGFYQKNLTSPCEMARIIIPTAYNVFPELSVGRHRLTIRFLTPNYQGNGHPKPTSEDIDFELNCCRI